MCIIIITKMNAKFHAYSELQTDERWIQMSSESKFLYQIHFEPHGPYINNFLREESFWKKKPKFFFQPYQTGKAYTYNIKFVQV